jgi:hypothetical protein
MEKEKLSAKERSEELLRRNRLAKATRSSENLCKSQTGLRLIFLLLKQTPRLVLISRGNPYVLCCLALFSARLALFDVTDDVLLILDQ